MRKRDRDRLFRRVNELRVFPLANGNMHIEIRWDDQPGLFSRAAMAEALQQELREIVNKEVEPCKPVPQVRHVGTLEEGYEAADIPGESLTGEAM